MKNYTKIKPRIDPTAFIAPTSTLIGKVSVGKNSSIWYATVIRADINAVSIGDFTNIQDCCVLHVADDAVVKIGNNVTIGHNANLHGCTIEDDVLVGIGAIVLNGAVLKKGCQIGAGAVVCEGSIIEENSLALGIPARIIRKLTKEELRENLWWAEKYSMLRKIYKENIYGKKRNINN